MRESPLTGNIVLLANYFNLTTTNNRQSVSYRNFLQDIYGKVTVAECAYWTET